MDIEKKIFIADSHFGQFIPQLIAENEVDNPLWNWAKVPEEDIQILKDGPENECYWLAWEQAIDNIEIVFEGYNYFLLQNEDLWAIREDATEEEINNWII